MAGSKTLKSPLVNFIHNYYYQRYLLAKAFSVCVIVVAIGQLWIIYGYYWKRWDVIHLIMSLTVIIGDSSLVFNDNDNNVGYFIIYCQLSKQSWCRHPKIKGSKRLLHLHPANHEIIEATKLPK